MSDDALHIATIVLPSGEQSDLWVQNGEFVEGPVAGQTIHSPGFGIAGLVDTHAHPDLASLSPGAALEELSHSGGWVKVIGDFFDEAGTDAGINPHGVVARDIRLPEGDLRVFDHPVLIMLGGAVIRPR